MNPCPLGILVLASGAIDLMRPSATSTLACAMLQLHPENPHYFLFRGKPTVLVASGEHYGAVLNQDWTVNDVNHAAAPGSILQIFATGLSTTGTITGHIFDRDIPVPYYAGPAPGLLGVQQIDLVVPGDLTAMTTEVSVCETGADSNRVCSIPAPLTLK